MIPFKSIFRWPSPFFFTQLKTIIDTLRSIFTPYSIFRFLLYALIINRANILLSFFDVFIAFDPELRLHKFVISSQIFNTGSQTFDFFIFLRDL